MDISIIIPAYNEEQRIEPTIRSVNRYLSDLPYRYEIAVVDDSSTDGTQRLVESLGLELPAVRCISSAINRGKGHAVRVGMIQAQGLVRLMYDADGSMPPHEMAKLFGPVLAKERDIVIGSRYAKGASATVDQPRWRVAWSRLANRVIQRSLVPGIQDTQCGFKAFSANAARVVFSRASIDGWAFDLEALALARRLGFDIAEVGITWTDDARSRVSPLRDFVRVVREYATIRRNLRRGVYRRLSEPTKCSQCLATLP